MNMSIKEMEMPFFAKSHAYFDNISKCEAFLFQDWDKKRKKKSRWKWKRISWRQIKFLCEFLRVGFGLILFSLIRHQCVSCCRPTKIRDGEEEWGFGGGVESQKNERKKQRGGSLSKSI